MPLNVSEVKPEQQRDLLQTLEDYLNTLESLEKKISGSSAQATIMSTLKQDIITLNATTILQADFDEIRERAQYQMLFRTPPNPSISKQAQTPVDETQPLIHSIHDLDAQIKRKEHEVKVLNTLTRSEGVGMTDRNREKLERAATELQDLVVKRERQLTSSDATPHDLFSMVRQVYNDFRSSIEGFRGREASSSSDEASQSEKKDIPKKPG